MIENVNMTSPFFEKQSAHVGLRAKQADITTLCVTNPFKVTKVKIRGLFHQGFMSSNLIFFQNSLDGNHNFIDPIRSQICVCHDSWAVVTWAILWPDQIITFQATYPFRDLDYELISSLRNGTQNTTGTNIVAQHCLHLHDVKQKELILISASLFNTMRPEQDGHHFADDIFKSIFLNEKVCILIKISLKFVPKCPTHNNQALV